MSDQDVIMDVSGNEQDLELHEKDIEITPDIERALAIYYSVLESHKVAFKNVLRAIRRSFL